MVAIKNTVPKQARNPSIHWCNWSFCSLPKKWHLALSERKSNFVRTVVYIKKLNNMILQIPDDLFGQLKLTEKELLLELAIRLFQRRILSIRKAAKLSTVSQKQFRDLLSKRDIPFISDEKMQPLEPMQPKNNKAAKRLTAIHKFIGTASYPDYPVSKYDVYGQ